MSRINERPLFIVFNTGSGQGAVNATLRSMETVLANSERRYEIMIVEQAAALSATVARAVKQAEAQHGIVVAAGGDGTLNAVCQALVTSDIPLGLVPLGTFNYFARNYGIPQDTALATGCLLDAQTQRVQVGLVNGEMFLVNASLGLYPQLLEDREHYKKGLGRSRTVAFVSALATLMRAHRKFQVEINVDGTRRQAVTTSLVVANNALQLEQLGLEQAAALEQSRLVAALVKPMGSLALYLLLLRGLLRRLVRLKTSTSLALRR